MLEGRRHEKGEFMKKNEAADQNMLPEYDFRGGTRGKYAKRFREGTNLVVLEPDLVRDFPDSRSVNKALRAYKKLVTRPAKVPSRKIASKPRGQSRA